MQRQVWFPLMTSVGVGAAVYYGMTRSGTRAGRMLRQMIPILPTLTGVSQNQNGQQQQPQQQQQPMQNSGSQQPYRVSAQ